MSNPRSRWVAVATLVLLVTAGGLSACEIPLPPPLITVTSTAPLPDANIGDGICEATAGAGNCTLLAAIAEGNAFGRADITIPDGVFDMAGTPLPSITGDLTIDGVGPITDSAHGFSGTRLRRTSLHVAAGGVARIDGVQPGVHDGRPPVWALVARVDGILVLGHSTLAGGLIIGPGGIAMVQNTVLWGGSTPLDNAGTAYLRHVTIAGIGQLGGEISTTGAGVTHLTSTLIDGLSDPGVGCTGTAPVSHGYNLADSTTCGLNETGDVQGVEPVGPTSLFLPPFPILPAASAAVDAIPIGVNGCGTEVTDDIAHRARPTDGNVDTVVACDIGAVERP